MTKTIVAASPMMLGEIDISPYVHPPLYEYNSAKANKERRATPTAVNERRAVQLKQMISDIGVPMNVEQVPLELLKQELAQLEALPALEHARTERERYLMQCPVIDTSFLSMSREIDFRGNKIKVPRFSVYHYGPVGGIVRLILVRGIMISGHSMNMDMSCVNMDLSIFG